MYLKIETNEAKKNTIVFIQRKKRDAKADDPESQFTYDVHGHDAWFIDRHFCKTGYFKLFTHKGVIDRTNPYKTEDGKKYNGLPFITLKQSHFHQYVRGLLLNHGKRVEIWSEDKYECLKSASPGNLQEFEELLENDSQTGVVCAIYIKKELNERKIGLAFADTTLRTIGFCSFTDSDQLANLDSTLSQIETKEALVFYQKNDPDSERLKDVLRRSNILETERKKSDFVKKSTLEADICRLTGEERVMNLEFNEEHVANSTQALLDYLELLDDINNYSHYKTKSQQISLFMKLDSTCVSSLNILPPPNDRSKNTSLFGLLNQCVTRPGARLLREWIRQPLTSHSEIEKRLDMVQIFAEENELREEIKELLKKVPDLDKILIRVVKQRVTIEDIVKLYICVQQVPAVKEVMNRVRNEKSFVKDNLYMDLMVHLDSNYADLQSFLQMVISIIDMEATEKHEYRINCKIDAELEKLMNDLNEIISQCDEECKSVENDLNVNELFLEMTKKSVCFKVKKAQANALTGATNYTLIGPQSKSDVKFTNDTLKELAKSYIDILEQYESKSQETLQKIREVVTTFAPAFTQLRETLASIDIFISFASVSVNAAIPYTRPIIRPIDYEEEEIILYDCRHPVVEIQDSVDFKENTCILDRSQHQLHLITGPNMGGKSTFIRQVAINVIMAQIGCFIPAREGSIVTVRDAILSRVGASDSTQRGISTFMAEMLETAALLSTATSKSLIIVDELGRGTSTYDGFGLAYAIIEHLMDSTNAFTLFATHFHELRALIEKFPAICNERMDSKIIDNRLVMLYQIVTDNEEAITENSNSFGIEVAKLADFPIDVIRVAESKAEEIKQLMNTTQLQILEPSTKEVADSQRRAKIHSALSKFYNFNFSDRTLQEIKTFLLDNFNESFH
ncbi:DNA mismatch repair protein muts [Naegleria gruberi]|uniref:DNA mismatch repair protein muts n=1 Tax=Naegleria gruberi TaxID=5762 RepID=D2V0B3_NAEGR|nr:DNA mismatch repair protein muts [Naegleria gruberi]EFC49687.1 DNA mismatch repair protein muts [Naegleria gruberi]|eukprot:XP_002682431.1 DNA mismatch repair protein muts [Naegleria gruberi strain NEG-M]